MTFVFYGPALKGERLAQHLTRQAFAQRAERSIASVVAWETGVRTPTPENLLHIAEVLGVDPSRLVVVAEPDPHVAGPEPKPAQRADRRAPSRLGATDAPSVARNTGAAVRGDLGGEAE